MKFRINIIVSYLGYSWTATSNQSILKEINPEYSLEGLVLKLMLQILWPPDAKSRLTGKDPDAGKDWREKEKGMAEDEMVRLHHQLNGYESEKTLGKSGGQRARVSCDPRDPKESGTTQQLSNNPGSSRPGMRPNPASSSWPVNSFDSVHILLHKTIFFLAVFKTPHFVVFCYLISHSTVFFILPFSSVFPRDIRKPQELRLAPLSWLCINPWVNWKTGL